ncbi:MAG: hypothetical protein NTX58_12445 [Actinobacteria bacterium]|nr:hypothetical protein [Actinomycetota bacterium]
MTNRPETASTGEGAPVAGGWVAGGWVAGGWVAGGWLLGEPPELGAEEQAARAKTAKKEVNSRVSFLMDADFPGACPICGSNP